MRPVDTFTCHAHEGRATLALHAASPVEIYFAAAPGQPAQQEHGMVLARGTGATGVIHTVIAWTGVTVQFGASALTVETRHGERHVHRRDDRGWHVELQAGGARSSIDLAGFVDQPESRTEGEPMRRVPIRVHRSANTFSWLSERRERDTTGQLEYALGERHYRRSETSWEASGRPVAQVVITATGESLVIHGLVHAGDAVFAPADARNPYDNEHPDTMAAGVQLHLRDAGESSSWMLVPEPDPAGAVRVRPVTASARAAPVARWRPVSDGWEFRIDVPLPPGREIPIALDVIINETIRGRARRRGQLVLSGAQGEWAYLRGDRQGDEHLVPMVIVP